MAPKQNCTNFTFFLAPRENCEKNVKMGLRTTKKNGGVKVERTDLTTALQPAPHLCFLHSLTFTASNTVQTNLMSRAVTL